MKWFFCWCQDTDFRSDHNWTDLIRVSVESALLNTSLEPHLIYDGEPSPFTDELMAKGVKVFFHRLSFTREIMAHQPNDLHYQAIARGAFLRFDIPLLADADDEFVLYTDADVMFMHNEPMTGYKPALLAAAPQFDRGVKTDMNSGVMILNVSSLRATREQLIGFTVKNLHLGLDQEVLRAFLGTRYLLLPDTFNWKPYWGINPDASIIHWHGPKPETVGKMIDGKADGVNETWRHLFDLNRDSYRHYVGEHRRYGGGRQNPAPTMTGASAALARPGLTRCVSLIGAHRSYRGDPEIEEVRDVFCVPPSAAHQRDWGIFNADRSLVPSTGFYRGRGGGQMLPMQENFTTADLGSVGEEAPDDVYIYGGKLHPHYGHFLLSTLSRFWMFGSGERPKMKILMHEETDPSHWFTIPHMAFCFGHLGITKDDFVKFDGPVRVRRLIVPHPSFVEEHSGYEAFARLSNGIGQVALTGLGSGIGNDDRPAYLSKSKLNHGVWRFINEHDIEQHLERHGVEIVHPEQIPLSEQIKLFVQNRTIVSTMSSALHTSIFSWTGPHVIGIGHTGCAVSNYTISDEINGGTGRYFYPETGVEHLPADANFTLNCRLIDPRKVAEDVLRVIDRKKANLKANSRKYPFGKWPNIALGRPASQSSVCQWSSSQNAADDAAGAVNGIKDGHQGFHTEIENEPWWIVDLGGPYGIYEIKLFNRLDIPGVAERSAKLAIDIGLGENSLVEVYRRNEGESFGGIDGDPLIFRPDIPIIGRYVRVRLLQRDYLHLDQVEVYGDCSTFTLFSNAKVA